MKSLRNPAKALWIVLLFSLILSCGGRNTGSQNGDSGIQGNGVSSTASSSGQTTDYGGSPGAIYTFVGWDASTTTGSYPDKMTIRCTSVLDPTLAATVAGTYTGSTSVSAVSFGANGEGLGGISVLNTGTQNSNCKYDSSSGTANLSASNAISGTGIPASTTIVSVDSATQVTMSANATATTTGLAITANGTTKFGDITNGSAVVTNLVSAGTISGIDVDPLDATGKTGIKVFYEAAQISDQTREYGIQLQYDCGSGYTALGTDFKSSDSQVGTSTGYSQMGPYSLPAACNNNSAIKLRWRYYYLSGASGSRTRIALRNIRVSTDTTATTFAGLSTATASDYQTVNLTWPAATDDVTTASYMRYDIYQATSSGGYGTAAYGTQPTVIYSIRGTTSTTISGLNPSTNYFFVIRARDEQGNRNASGAINTGSETEKSVTTPADTTPPTVSTIFPTNGINVSTTTTSIPVTFNVAMDTTTLTLASTNFQVKSGSDCTGTALTGASIVASGGNKTFTLTLNGGQLVAGNNYTTCLTANVKSAGAVALSTYSVTWKAVSGTNVIEGFESWATANQPTNWTFGGVTGLTATSITQDGTTPHGGSLSAKITGTLGGSNGNMLNSGTLNAGSCTRVAIWMRGTTTGKSLSVQLQSAGGTGANYCNINNGNIASSISAATAITPVAAAYTGTDINTSGNWMVAVCSITGMAGGSMDLLNFRGGSSGVYAISFDDISFLDDNNNPCIPVDTTPPTVSSTTPANAATNISYGSTIAVTFSEGMNTSTVTGQISTSCTGSIQVSSDNFSTCVAMTSATPSFASNTATLTPASALAPNTTYLIRVTTAVQDSAGNALASQFTTAAGFTTAALADPTSVVFTPGDTQITVGWTNSSNANAGVKILRATGSAPTDCNSGTTVCQGNGTQGPSACNATLTTGSSGRTYVDTSLTNSTAYYYRVCANHTSPATLSTGVTGNATPNNAFNVNSAASTANTTATVTFSAAPNTGQAQTAGNYEIVLAASACGSGGVIAVSSPSLSGNTVTLTTATQSAVSYKICVSNVTRNSDSAVLTTNNATFTGTAAGATFWEAFENWTSGLPNSWVCGGTTANPAVGNCPTNGISTGSITQDTTSPKQGSSAMKISATTTGNTNMLSWGGATLSKGSCTRVAIWVRGTSTAKAIALQTSTGTAAYCNFGTSNLADSIALATPVASSGTANYGAAMTTSGSGANWQVVVCTLPATFDTMRFRGGTTSTYSMSFDAIEFLDNSNAHCDIP